MSQADNRNLKTLYVTKVQKALEAQGMDTLRIVKGLAIEDPDTGNYIVIDAVVKTDFDVEDAMLEWDERLEKDKEKAKKRADKLAKSDTSTE